MWRGGGVSQYNVTSIHVRRSGGRRVGNGWMVTVGWLDTKTGPIDQRVYQSPVSDVLTAYRHGKAHNPLPAKVDLVH